VHSALFVVLILLTPPDAAGGSLFGRSSYTMGSGIVTFVRDTFLLLVRDVKDLNVISSLVCTESPDVVAGVCLG
jgi:hypothetical protein